MLNRFLALTMMVVFLMGSITKSLLFLDYELRQDYFASVLCEKKEVPNNTCQGGCHLNKELKAQDEQERKQGSDSQVKFEMYSLAPPVVVLSVVENYIDFRFLPYKSIGYLTVLFIDFRPPIV